MSKKEPTLFETVYKAFGDWSPGGCIKGNVFVFPLKAKALPNFDSAMSLLNSTSKEKLETWKITGFETE